MATAFRSEDGADEARREVDAYIEASARKSLLRFITCGSVDDGKSTLIGRLLYDSRLLFEDQLAALESDSRRSGNVAEGLDLSLLVDGLAAEREQGITIDVAYRFFATGRRKFIVADTPGHEQYTRNMVTGASTADLAVILVDATKGVLTQTRRHSFLVHLLGIRNLVLAVNKMDLAGYDEAIFSSVVADYRRFAREAGIEGFTAIPMVGLTGDNVTSRSERMGWYDGPSLLEHLETVPAAPRALAAEPFRMAVQWVNRPSADFRGYAGRIASGRIRVGDEIAVLPAGRRSRVSRIVTFDGDLDQAKAGQSVTLTLADPVDCARGDLIAAPEGTPPAVQRIGATLVWMGEEALAPRRAYALKIGARTLNATVSRLRALVDVNSLDERPAATLALNDIGRVEIDLDRPIPGIPYAESRRLGGFILIDRLTHATVAAGLVEDFPLDSGRGDGAAEGAILWLAGDDRAERARRRAARSRAIGRTVAILDEATLAALNGDLGEADRGEKLRRVREVARLISGAGADVLIALDAAPEESRPGRRIEPGEPEEGEDIWVI
ncbi:MAG: sulfate adenylyltransferase subunit CysN [Alphaproteobacteria bacterium]|nr:sulfate adenylyltransferase subunit CysN [Alphaproteobacteria bacterium]MBV9370553.1 sulfate adenylyltransferase subunit CysN [Alphaproteobacteria bacterium]MBV9900079.1 sulfate adenylyltransferase subunit CysN [Alphaproteobacteria bacterium]